MTKVIWLSDLHFSAQGRIQGYDTAVRLRAAVDFINEHHGDAACCVISGDLVDRGTSDDYAALARQLSAIQLPVYPLAGNHDTRAFLRQSVELPKTAMPDFVQYSVDLGSTLVLCLDSQKEGSDAGYFCEARSQWLTKALKAAGARQVLVFVHHPPLVLGLPMQDQDRMKGGDAFLDLLAASGASVHLCIGHVHRPISGHCKGVPFTTMRSVLYQAPPPQPAWDWSTFAPAQEAPDLGVISVSKDAVAIQYQSFCDAALGAQPQ